MTNKRNKTILMFLLAFIVSVFALTIVACSKPQEQEKPIIVTVTLDKTITSFSTYETPTFNVTVEGVKGDYTVVWTSSDTTVATVNNGKVVPKKAGTTVIKAAVGDVYDECTIEFFQPVLVPEAHIEYITLNVYMGRTKQLEAYATYDGRELEGGVFTFTAADDTVVSISSSGVAEGLRKGSTTVTVNGTVQGDALTPCTFTLNVLEDLFLSPNVSINTSVYMGVGRDSAHPFTTTYTVNPTVTLNSVTLGNDLYDKVYFELSTENSDIVDTEGMNIIGKRAGEAIVRLTVTTLAGTSDYEEFVIVVEKPYATVTPTSEVFVEAKPGADKADVSYLGLTDNVVRVEVNGERTTCFTYVSSTNMFGAKEGIPYGKDANVKIESESEIIFTTMTIAAVNIKTKADMSYFVGRVATWSINEEKPYVIMSANIDYGGDVYDPGFGRYFYGTFDGQGHKFSNAVLNNGFFSRTGLGSLVKNIAIVGCSLKPGCDNPAFIRDVMGTVQDIYFSCDIANMGGTVAGVPLTYSIETRTPDRNGSVTNLIAEITNSSRVDNPVITRYLEGPIKNVYVLVNPNSFNASYFGGKWQYKQGKGTYENVGLYTSESEFKANIIAGENIAAKFDTSANGVWQVKNGKLVFKTM